MDIPMLFAVTLNSARLGRRPSHPRHCCDTSYCRRSCALGFPSGNVRYVQLVTWLDRASRDGSTTQHQQRQAGHHQPTFPTVLASPPRIEYQASAMSGHSPGEDAYR